MSGIAALPTGWLSELAVRLDRPPARPRVALWWGHQAIGTVEAEWVASLIRAAPQAGPLLRPASRHDAPGYELDGDDLTGTLGRLADAMRESGHAHAWRNEQLAVTNAQGQVLATIERAAVRPLGIATRAVHLMGQVADGRHWVQQRTFDKATDPGLWDTLMGGMVPASDTVDQALARETWEEAGLRTDQLQALRLGGQVTSRGPSGDVQCGYVVEVIDWYRCVLPDGLVPSNQDGEVAQFKLVEGDELVRMLLAGMFTLEAAGIFGAAGRAAN